VAFSVNRWAGLRAVPGGAVLETKAGSEWTTGVPLNPGEYHFSFFYRCFNPTNMNAQNVATGRPVVALDAPSWRDPVVVGPGLDAGYLWLRGEQTFTMRQSDTLRVSVTAQGPEAVQVTGLALSRLK